MDAALHRGHRHRQSPFGDARRTCRGAEDDHDDLHDPGRGDRARQPSVRPSVALFRSSRVAPVPVAMDVARDVVGDSSD